MTELEARVILGDNPNLIDAWFSINPTVFYKDGKPYGLVALIHEHGFVSIASASVNNGKFTASMIAKMLGIYNNYNTSIIFSRVSDNVDQIRTVLAKRGFTFVEVQEHYIAYREKE